MLVVKELNVTRLTKKQPFNSLLVLSIDKFLGCWDKVDNKECMKSLQYLEEKPVFHLHIS